jgi:hypothetical protein
VRRGASAALTDAVLQQQPAAFAGVPDPAGIAHQRVELGRALHGDSGAQAAEPARPPCSGAAGPGGLPLAGLGQLGSSLAPPCRPEPHPEATQHGPRPPRGAPEDSSQVVSSWHRYSSLPLLRPPRAGPGAICPSAPPRPPRRSVPAPPRRTSGGYQVRREDIGFGAEGAGPVTLGKGVCRGGGVPAL